MIQVITKARAALSEGLASRILAYARSVNLVVDDNHAETLAFGLSSLTAAVNAATLELEDDANANRTFHYDE